MPLFIMVRERGPDWNWSLSMRKQPDFAVHAAFMDALGEERFIIAGGPLGDEDRAARVLHIIEAPSKAVVEARMDQDPWGQDMLTTVSIEPWNVLIGSLERS